MLAEVTEYQGLLSQLHPRIRNRWLSEGLSGSRAQIAAFRPSDRFTEYLRNFRESRENF
jgi:hypothetical protein